MATGTFYPNGMSMGVGNPNPTGGIRGEVIGWSRGSVRRHKAWLKSLELADLTGDGYAVTLTLLNTPPTETDWRYLLERLFDGLRERGTIRYHWVVEWQRRGAPHLHLAAYSVADAEKNLGYEAVKLWLRLTKEYGSGLRSQDVNPITSLGGWNKYCSKHASRGVEHYQRHGKPAGWIKTGRLWGYGGDWPTAEAIKAQIEGQEFNRMRRMVRSWAIADARTRLFAQQENGDRKKIKAARKSLVYCRTMLKSNQRGHASVRGVNDWIPLEVSLRMLESTGWQGQTPQPTPSLPPVGSARAIFRPGVQRSTQMRRARSAPDVPEA